MRTLNRKEFKNLPIGTVLRGLIPGFSSLKLTVIYIVDHNEGPMGFAFEEDGSLFSNTLWLLAGGKYEVISA